MEYENLHKVQKYSHSMISGFTQTKSPAKPIQTLSSKWAPLSLWHSAIMRRVYLWCVFFLRFGNWTKFDINTSRKSIEKVITVQVLNFAVMCQCCWDWSKHPERERENSSRQANHQLTAPCSKLISFAFAVAFRCGTRLPFAPFPASAFATYSLCDLPSPLTVSRPDAQWAIHRGCECCHRLLIAK